MEPNEHLLRPIYEFGRGHGWQIERCGRRIPRHWSGDGVISDYQEVEELRAIDRFERTPIVSRILPPGGNIRTVRADTTRTAQMTVDYLTNKGFIRFVSVIRNIWPEILDGKPRDILAAIRNTLEERGLSFECCLWEELHETGEEVDYRKRRQHLRHFLRRIAPPFAVIASNSAHLPILYRVLHELKLRVPEEVAVLVNTDDWKVTENAVIPTSYISGQFQEFGEKLCELLARMMAGEEVLPHPIYVSPSGIVARRSTDTLAVADLRLAKAVSFFFQNYMNLISVEDAARVAGVSRSLLTRLFQEEFGKAPQRFLLEIRLNQIHHLLDSTPLTVTEIAARTGYGSDMALALAFKRETGLTPGFYRISRRRLS